MKVSRLILILMCLMIGGCATTQSSKGLLPLAMVNSDYTYEGSIDPRDMTNWAIVDSAFSETTGSLFFMVLPHQHDQYWGGILHFFIVLEDEESDIASLILVSYCYVDANDNFMYLVWNPTLCQFIEVVMDQEEQQAIIDAIHSFAESGLQKV